MLHINLLSLAFLFTNFQFLHIENPTRQRTFFLSFLTMLCRPLLQNQINISRICTNRYSFILLIISSHTFIREGSSLILSLSLSLSLSNQNPRLSSCFPFPKLKKLLISYNGNLEFAFWSHR